MRENIKVIKYCGIITLVFLVLTYVVTVNRGLRQFRSRLRDRRPQGRATRLCPAIRKSHFEIYNPVGAFAGFLRENRDKMEALNIVCTRPRELTRESLKNLRLALDRANFTSRQLNTAIREMTNEEITADIITLIRRYAIGSHLLSHEERIKGAVARLRKAHSFSVQELNCLKRMEKYLLEESVLNVAVFEEDSRFKAQGGFAKIDKVFAGRLEAIIRELNEYLYDDGGSAA